jgi:Mg-chelatase subunit ChlD
MGLIAAIFFLDNTAVTASQRDVIFVLDNSGSMHENDPNIITSSIISAFIAQLHKTDQVGIVIFDESARLVAPLTPLNTPNAHEKLSEALAQMNYRGQRTNTPAAIERAVYELRSNGRKDSMPSIIFLTDGIIDTGNTNKDAEMAKWLIDDLTTECVAHGIKIFGIAFTEKADYHLIQSLAAKTKGAYFRALKTDDISKVFKEIIGLLSATIEKTSEMAVKKVDRSDQPPISNANVTTVAIKKKETGFTPTSLIQRLNWTIIVFVGIATVGFFIFLFLRQKKKRSMKFSPTASIEEDDSQNFVPEAQLLGLDKNSMDGSEPQMLYLLNKRKITIGRDPQNIIVIPKPTISNFHATIHYVDDHFQVEDNLSTNGTFVKDSRLPPNQPARLKHGDIVKFATVDFRFLSTESTAVTETIMRTKRLSRNDSDK